MLVYGPDNRHRARLTETDDGVVVAFYRFSGLRDTRGVNISQLDPADVPHGAMWAQIERAVIDRPFHVVCDHVAALLATVTP